MKLKKLNTIQKSNKLNNIYAEDEKGNGNAYHRYTIRHYSDDKEKGIGTVLADIQFQNGARKEQDSISGVSSMDLLEIVRHNLQCFQSGEFATRENAIALTKVEEALLWLNKRSEDRAERNVLGKNVK